MNKILAYSIAAASAALSLVLTLRFASQISSDADFLLVAAYSGIWEAAKLFFGSAAALLYRARRYTSATCCAALTTILLSGSVIATASYMAYVDELRQVIVSTKAAFNDKSADIERLNRQIATHLDLAAAATQANQLTRAASLLRDVAPLQHELARASESMRQYAAPQPTYADSVAKLLHTDAQALRHWGQIVLGAMLEVIAIAALVLARTPIAPNSVSVAPTPVPVKPVAPIAKTPQQIPKRPSYAYVVEAIQQRHLTPSYRTIQRATGATQRQAGRWLHQMEFEGIIRKTASRHYEVA